MSKHRGAPVRPRYGRLAAFGSSLAVTMIAVLAGTGLLPSAIGGDSPADGGAVRPAAQTVDEEPKAAASTPAAEPEDATAFEATSPESPAQAETEGPVKSKQAAQSARSSQAVALPPDSGEGRRVVFSQSQQRVWLVGDAERVQSTYLVSGSLTDNLDPGTYAVYSRSEQAWGIDDSGTMKYFVRFTRGERAAIGFHDIPIDDGRPVQTLDQLGTPQSHGCIRQKRADAIRLWNFAPIGTTVVVTA